MKNRQVYLKLSRNCVACVMSLAFSLSFLACSDSDGVAGGVTDIGNSIADLSDTLRYSGVVQDLQGFEIHRLRNLLDRFRREVEPPANHVQAVRGTAEPRLRRKETVRKHGAHFLLLFEIVLHELAEVIVIKKMFQRDTHAYKLHYFYTKTQFLIKKACKTSRRASSTH